MSEIVLQPQPQEVNQEIKSQQTMQQLSPQATPDQSQKPELIVKKRKWIVPLIGLAIFILAITLVSLYLYQKGKTGTKLTNQSSSGLTTPTPPISQAIGSPASLSDKNFTITLPGEMKANESSSYDGAMITTLDQIRALYEDAKTQGGCPGACSTLIEDDNLQKQFDFLKEVAGLETCTITEKVKTDAKSFILFDGGIGSKDVIDVIWNDNLGVCGIKFMGADGYDAWLGNYEYEVGFLVDNSVVHIRFELFPHGVFPEVDELWNSFGLSGGSCDSDCLTKQYNYMQNVDYQSDLINSIVSKYDTSVESFRFLTE